jgi:N-acylglucosamine-6-phosphate 2-epimerase
MNVQLQRGLIVSCQASAGEPLASPTILAAMAQAAVAGGAIAVRAEHPDNIAAIRQVIQVPVIGLLKRRYDDSELHITPTLSDALAVANSGAHVVAMDATVRPRPNRESLEQIVTHLHGHVRLMADVSTLQEGLRAAELGFDYVSTTLSGYTSETAGRFGETEPDFELVSDLSKHLNGRVPVIAEGRISTPNQAAEMFRRGAFAVVVGTAITRPSIITRRFVEAMPALVA